MSAREVLERVGWRVVGKPVPRHDAWDKVLARTAYAADWEMPGMLVGKVLRSLHPSARIVRLDTERARSLPGVVAVLTARDVPRNTLWTDVPGQTTEVGPLRAKVHVLAEERVRYQGEPVALVAAESEELAEEALRAIEVEYDPVPGVFDPQEALSPGAPLVHSDSKSNLLARWTVRTGDVRGALARADVVVEGTYRTQFVDHAYLEPEAGVAWVDSDGVLTIRVATQVIEHFRDVADVLGLPHNKVRVIGTYLGGGFGGKEDVTVEVFLGLLAWVTRRPVKMVWTRQESLLARPKRHPFVMRYRTGALRTGELVAQEVELLADAGAYAFLSALVLLYASTTACGPYRVPNVAVDAQVVYTNNPPTSAMRGFGAMQVVFAYEQQMDRLARELGMDPVELRVRNGLRKGDRLPIGQVLETHVALPEVARRAWQALGPAQPPSGPHLRVGRGLACNLQPYGRIVWLHDWASAWVGFEMDGSVLIRAGVPDVGAGQASSLCQIAGEVLGVPLDRVSIHVSDSALTPLAGTTTATRQLMMSGNAVLRAATELREHVLRVAAQLLETTPVELQLDGHEVRTPDGRCVSLVRVLRECARVGVPRSAFATYHAPAGDPIDLDRGGGRVFPDFTYGAHATEVEVDTETGAIRVRRYVACHDVGQAINPQSVEGQIQGGAVMGIGYALMERVILDAGNNQTTSFSTYLIPTSMDVPDVIPLVLESGEGMGPFGARGIGEPPVGPPAAAIANAVYDAVGVRVTELPIRSEAVARALYELAGHNG
ncbi:MAG: xanthine dehydrogenase family protein molybdopterin-binding subunit [Armatimonadota bacterium]|nr:xanthine dehydrogenase family protein molybdopterin-binding subunit [Armatimonadota bacterium]MDR5696400.1 xanthine dehydrogenase family protein molybdopterin-binding subunit [Armatimonadota bacterium]